ncbi:MAG: hypothetical protein FWD31_10280 [Planctomycetaceae bacterium]|nr:hypothetical protein [Planctomycetaceae bacterium]
MMQQRFLTIVFCFLFSSVLFAEEPKRMPMPYLLWERSLERTTFQQHGQIMPDFDLRTDAAMPYGITTAALDALKSYKEAGYILHLMTGISWGEYVEYLDGHFDGIDHWDQGQRSADGEINHGVRVPYMVPSISFGRFLEVGLKKALDTGVLAVHLEEPEFWARAGHSEAFKRAWQNYYGEPWQNPNETSDAQYRASKLKHYLYCRTIAELSESLKEYTLLKHKRELKFYVPTHSLINYAQWAIVSPESALLDLPGVDGLICQTWTGTARTANIYDGRRAERTFEGAFLEYGCMQELARGSGKRMYLLADPIEDNPNHDWDDYRLNYICTLVASLLAPDSHYYEVCPWPGRVFRGRYPAGSPDAQPIPGDYATMLLTVFNQLRDMDQPEIDWHGATDGIGIVISDSAMFQRAEPHIRDGSVPQGNDPTRPTPAEIDTLSGFFGLALPLVKHGVAVRPTLLENTLRYPGYLDRYKVLILSYEFQKPYSPGFHAVLADWVRRGGVLVYVGAETDPFHQARDWWNSPQTMKTYSSPSEHLFESLGMDPNPSEGVFNVGNGKLFVRRKHPAYYTRGKSQSDGYRELIRLASTEAKLNFVERNHFLLRRGPYLIGAVMQESVSDDPLVLKGRFLDLFEPDLTFKEEVRVMPNSQCWLIDMDKVTANAPAALAASGRIENWNVTESGLEFRLETPTRIANAVRLLLVVKPSAVRIDGEISDSWQWDEPSKTLLIRHKGNPKGTSMSVVF